MYSILLAFHYFTQLKDVVWISSCSAEIVELEHHNFLIT